MSIVPLPVFEADADPSRRDAMTDEEILARLRPPTSIVVKFGSMKLVAEYPYDGDAKPGCGSKLVVRTVRGTEMAEMLTTTCSNSGCGKSISRKEMLEYIDASGGKDYPFQEHGRVLRVATIDDLNRWSAIQADKPANLRRAREITAAAGMTIKIVEVEGLLGGETTIIYYLSEERIDFRDVVKEFATAFGSRIDMRQVGARDEARLTADYERCGQHCCCKNFLKVLKPVSMRSAKVQKATLDPLKISGRCGRLMCCLRYEDQTYTELKARLPKLKTRVGTSEGPGLIIDTKILVQLALVRLERDGREIAVPIEELIDPDACPPPAAEPDPLRGADPRAVARRTKRDRGQRGGESTPGNSASAGREGKRSRESRRRDRPDPSAASSAPAPAPESPAAAAEPTAGATETRSGSRAGSRVDERSGRAGGRAGGRDGRGIEDHVDGSDAAPRIDGERVDAAPTPVEPGTASSPQGEPRKKRRRRRKSRDGEKSVQDQQDAFRARSQSEEQGSEEANEASEGLEQSRDGAAPGQRRKKRRRRGRRRGKDGDGKARPTGETSGQSGGGPGGGGGDDS